MFTGFDTMRVHEGDRRTDRHRTRGITALMRSIARQKKTVGYARRLTTNYLASGTVDGAYAIMGDLHVRPIID